ncbi:MAG: tetratricopeptide repeat protein [Chloroflexi bacterium]|nr:tetratricopeptide repeat protein [Chloroflexota bacterium]MCI0576932.1 tetratricopeptide repeat protein [Chloroflexota bacterium]MCI0646920.1 tetratricopeptide repeat protein [Chloroflexota bacterium]MCI0731316.1 tetratricopeptide repeat protein [Chloroflexota bacterium]
MAGPDVRATGNDGPTLLRAEALNGLGGLVWDQGDYATARGCYEESLAIYRQLGNDEGVIRVQPNLAGVFMDQEEYAAARPLYEQSLVMARQLGYWRETATALNNLGLIAKNQGDYAAAHAFHEESLALKRELKDQRGIATSLNNLGELARLQGDDEAAQALFRENLALKQEISDKRGIAIGLTGLVSVAVAQGQLIPAARLLGFMDSLLLTLGVSLAPVNDEIRAQDTATIRAQLDEMTFATAWAEGQAMTLEQAVAYGLGKAL